MYIHASCGISLGVSVCMPDGLSVDDRLAVTRRSGRVQKNISIIRIKHCICNEHPVHRVISTLYVLQTITALL